MSPAASSWRRCPWNRSVASYFAPGPEQTAYVVPSLLFEDVSLKRPDGDAPGLPLLPPPWARER